MKTKIFSMPAFGSMRYARASSAQQARRIFARSLNADRPEGARAVRVSIDQVRYVGTMLPSNIGAAGYDRECNRMPQRFRDETAGESYMSVENVKDAKADSAVRNAEAIVSAYFD
jgi:hypothetical protein